MAPTSCSGDGVASCPDCVCMDDNWDCPTCNGEGLVDCEGCHNCADDIDPVEAAVGPEPEPEDE